MSTFQIKLIALILMVIDHIGALLFPEVIVLRWIGRLSAPLFLFCLVHGIDYTKSKKKYLLRLYGFAALMELIWIVFKLCGGKIDRHDNIFGTFFIVVAVICILQHFKWYVSIGILALWQAISVGLVILLDLTSGIPMSVEYLLSTLSGNAFLCNYGFLWVILGVLMYYLKNSKKQLAIGYSCYCVFLWFISATAIFARGAFFIGHHIPALGGLAEVVCKMITGMSPAFTPMTLHGLYFGDYQWLMIFSLPIMLQYNGTKGKSWKYFFYVFYPAHLILLAVLAQVL